MTDLISKDKSNSFECKHTTIFMGLCIECGLKEKEEVFNKKEIFNKSSNTIIKELEEKNKEMKLNLVLDLDQTLIHSIMKKKKDISIDIQSIPMEKTYTINNIIDNIKTETIYYNYNIGSHEFTTEIRPFLIDFFNELSPIYDFYIYTNGTKLYALKVVDIIKTHYKIYNKEENKSIKIKKIIYRNDDSNEFQKDLSKLHLINKNTVILDDRIDVWDFNESVLPIKPFRDIDINEVNINNKKFINNQLYDKDIELKKVISILKSIHEKYFNKSNNVFSEEELKEIEAEMNDSSSKEDINDIVDHMFDNLSNSTISGTSSSEDLELMLKNIKKNPLDNLNYKYKEPIIINKPKKETYLYYNSVPLILNNIKNIFMNYIIDSDKIFYNEIKFLGGKIFNEEKHKSADIGIEKENDVMVERKWLFDCLYSLEFKNTKYYRFILPKKRLKIQFPINNSEAESCTQSDTSLL